MMGKPSGSSPRLLVSSPTLLYCSPLISLIHSWSSGRRGLTSHKITLGGICFVTTWHLDNTQGWRITAVERLETLSSVIVHFFVRLDR